MTSHGVSKNWIKTCFENAEKTFAGKQHIRLPGKRRGLKDGEGYQVVRGCGGKMSSRG